jgi:hypothetical protein
LAFLAEDDWFKRGHNHFEKGKVHSDGHWRPTLRSGKFVWAPGPVGGSGGIGRIAQGHN